MNEGRRWKSKLWSEQGRTELEKLRADFIVASRSATTWECPRCGPPTCQTRS